MGYGSGLARIFPNLTYQCSPQVEKVVAAAAPGAMMLDLGAGGRRLHPDMKTVDFVDSGATDYVADVCAVPLEDAEVDLIVATGLLEHVQNEHDFLSECKRLVKPGGKLHIEVPFLQQYHDDPIDMRRYTQSGLEEFVQRYGFEVDQSGFHIGPSVTVATLNAYWASFLFPGNNPVSKVLSNGAFFLVSLMGYPMKFLDKWVMRNEQAHRLAFGVYVTATRKA